MCALVLTIAFKLLQGVEQTLYYYGYQATIFHPRVKKVVLYFLLKNIFLMFFPMRTVVYFAALSSRDTTYAERDTKIPKLSLLILVDSGMHIFLNV